MLRTEVTIVLVGEEESQTKFLNGLKEGLRKIAPLGQLSDYGYEAILDDLPITVVKTSVETAEDSVENIKKAANIIIFKDNHQRRDFKQAIILNKNNPLVLGGDITLDPYACIQKIAEKNGKKLPNQPKAEASIPPLPVVVNSKNKPKVESSFFAEFKKIKNAFKIFDEGLANKINEQNAKTKVQIAEKPDPSQLKLN